MSKYLTCIVFIIALLMITATDCRAQESDSSATLKTRTTEDDYDYRVANLTKFLDKYNSPLACFADDFITIADKYNIDYRLVPAITGVESTFGKRIPKNSYNAYGWANGEYSFNSWQESIEIVSKTLRTNYVDKGAETVNKIARIYAPPSATWAGNVKFFMNKIDPLPVPYDI